MHRIAFDTNEGSQEAGYWLWLPVSLKSLEKIKGEIFEGERVVIFMEGELEMEAFLKFDRERGYWIAMPVSGTIKYLDGSA